MKLSAILVSVTLPVAATTAAYGAEPTKSGTADWLKSNLASLDTSGKQKKSKPRKGAYSQPIADASGGLHAGSALKLRPFVPNRRLPSQRDLDMQLISQTARMATAQPAPSLAAQTPMMANPAPLSGNVAEVYSMMPYGNSSGAANVATYGSVGYVKQSSSRVVPGQVPAVQNQIRQFRSGKRTRYIAPPSQPIQAEQPADMSSQMSMQPGPMMQQQIPMQPGQLVQQQMQMQQPIQMMQQQMQMQQPIQMMQQMAQQPMQQQMQPQRFNAPMLMPCQAPPFSPDEQVIIDRMSQGQSSLNGSDPATSAGPPPFPLSLLPPDQLKQIIGASRSHRSDAPPSYFGCWHGTPASNLPQSGFHTYTGGRSSSRSSSYSHYTPHQSSSGPLAYRQASHSRPTAAVETTHTLAQLRRLPSQDIKVAAYSSYPRLSGAGY